MTVKELREKLEGLPDDMPVLVNGYESGVQAPGLVVVVNANFRGKRARAGDHEAFTDEAARYVRDAASHFGASFEPFKALLISRSTTV